MRAAASPLRSRFVAMLTALPEGAVLRGLFAAMLATTIAVLGLDYAEMQRRAIEQSAAAAPAPESDLPLPVLRRDDGTPSVPPGATDRRLAVPMTFDLRSDGRLLATGTIVPGSADAFAAEIDKRGAYVRTVVLHSPGGSVQDALRIGRLIRDRKFATEVESGAYCASSCPLVFAGGVERRAGVKAAIGVHQVSAAAGERGIDRMDSAQRVSAACQKYLRDMGVDPEVWIHAMETPRQDLHVFKPGDLLRLKLATAAGGRIAGSP